jgi:protein involved in polysaccharide export with SLBB domain
VTTRLLNMTNVTQHMGFWGGWSGILLAALVLAGCRTGGADPRFADLPGLTEAPAPAPDAVPSAGTPATPATFTNSAPTPVTDSGSERETLQKGDAISISFSDLPIPQADFQDRIKQDGTITLLQNQTFVAEGKTRRELEKEIRQRYVPQYFQTMTVSVRLTEQTRFYYVDGEVRSPNRQVYIGQMTVLKAISSAGGFTDFAQKHKVKLTRLDGRIYVVDCPEAIENPKLDLEVLPGDKIWVPRRWF